MAEHSTIEWTDATWNPITGCSVVSPGCTNCYAMKLAGTRMQHHWSRKGLTAPSKAGPVWTGEVRLNEEWLKLPTTWTRPRRIFVNAHSDLFHPAVPDEWILRILDVVRQCSHDGGSNIGRIVGGAGEHTFQVLTKRADRMAAFMRRLRFNSRAKDGECCLYLSNVDGQRPVLLKNLWLGVSIEDQARADERVPQLLQTPAAVRFVSAEPMLGPVNLRRVCIRPPVPGGTRAGIHFDSLCGRYAESGMPYRGDWDITTRTPPDTPAIKLDWVIAGGESGPGARPMHPDWARQIRDQCAEAGVPFLFKQWGEWAPGENGGAVTRTEQTADWFNGRWDFGRLPPRQSEEQHTDDAPDLYRLGKKAAGRHLDGVTHDGMPEVNRG